MARQVSGSNDTLLAAIEAGRVARPRLMSWNEWQQWRSGVGLLPTQSADGYTVSKRDESDLWRATMAYFYGPEWAITGMSAGLEADAPLASRPSEPGGAPAAGAGFGPPRPQPGSDGPPSFQAGVGSPGSGVPIEPAATAPMRSTTPSPRGASGRASATPLSSVSEPVSYTHLTLPTNREV